MDVAQLHVNRTWQYAVYAVICLIALIFIIILLPSSSPFFRRFFGETNPALVLLFAAVAGAGSLWLLQSRFNFVLFLGRGTIRGLALSAGLATLLAIAIVIADFFIRYPEDTNVPMPQAILFYPSMGFIAEIVFHVFPLALILVVLNPLGRWLGRERVIWLAIFIVAVLEPTFQMLFGGEALTWGSAYTWIHVFAIAFLQLYVFWRFDFVSMYGFRLIYYAYWHIL
ncbi:MAG: hypothetical protein ACW97O_17295, partial [Candidatus Thorarchaeota archaeon]